MNSLENKANELDATDPLKRFRDEFHIPLHDGQPQIYLAGNSLGLQPKRTREFVSQELDDWQRLGVRGHFSGEFPWLPYHEFLSETMAEIVGASKDEVVMMNSLTTNLHLMMATFYRPTAVRFKVLIEAHSFPSDFQAVQSQIDFHGFDSKAGMVFVSGKDVNSPVSTDSIIEAIENHKHELALVLLPGVQYYTGQVFNIRAIVEAAHKHEIPVGIDLAHAVGNIALNLSDWDVDFAVWCSYKYLNSGPGSVGGCFVHQRHASDTQLKRLAGWWGHEKSTRFKMKNEFRAIPTAEGWQLSNPPILSLAAIRASLDLFSECGGMSPLLEKSKLLTQFLEDCLTQMAGDQVEIITPTERGCQLSLTLKPHSSTGKQVHSGLQKAGVEADWREPNVVRVAPVPLYNSFDDCFRFAEILKHCLAE